jgi:hypothetical protein
VPSTCDNAVTDLSQTAWNVGGALQFTPRTTPRVIASGRACQRRAKSDPLAAGES